MHGHAERHVDKSIRQWTADGPDLKCDVPCQACEYTAMYRLKAVLPATHVWLGKCEVAKGSWFQARTVEMDLDGESAPGYGATLWIGTPCAPNPLDRRPADLKIGLKPDVLDALAPIWPRGFKLDWPATDALSLDQIVGLGDRIAASGIRMYPY